MSGTNVQFFERLAEERLRLGKTQKEMAAIGGVGDRSYWYYEKGERFPDAEFLMKIASEGADVPYIITGKRTFGALSSDEAALLDNYRAISPERKSSLIDVVDALSQKERSERKCG